MKRGETANDRRGRTEVVLSAKDRDRLDLIGEVFGVSRSAAIRVAIRAASEKLGLERETPDDFISEKSR